MFIQQVPANGNVKQECIEDAMSGQFSELRFSDYEVESCVNVVLGASPGEE